MKTVFFSAVLAIAGFGCSSRLSYDQLVPEGETQAQVIRDRFGVPHIFARDERALYFAFGRAQAQDQLERLVRNYRRAVGRLAEIDGDNALREDRIWRRMRLESIARENYSSLPEDLRGNLEAFVAGVNEIIAARSGRVPDWVSPVSPYETLAFGQMVGLSFLLGSTLGELRATGAPTLSWIPEAERWIGSNQFAVSPSRSESGAALLSMDPHLRFSGFQRWYEAHLVCGDLNVAGACFLGSPWIGMGHTENVAWSMTVNAPDLGDVFELELSEDRDTYKSPDGWKPLRSRKETFRIRDDDGGLRVITEPILDCELGPVFSRVGNRAYVVRLAGWGELRAPAQLTAMARAKDVRELRTALSGGGLVMFNIVSADTSGNIHYISNALVPKRSERPSTEAIRPAAEAGAAWTGYHSWDELPQVLNPNAGFVLNCNSGPQNVAPGAPIRPEDFPTYFMRHEDNDRSLRLRALLQADESVSFVELHRYAVDAHILAADRWVDPFLERLEKEDRKSLPAGDRRDLAAVEMVLKSWDRSAKRESRGTALFLKIAGRLPDPKAESASNSLVPQVLKLARELKEQLGAFDVAWGEVHRLRRGSRDEGVRGLATGGAITLRPTAGRPDRNGRDYVRGGSSYGMVVEMTNPPRSRSCLPFGISDDPESKHFADQLPLYARGDYKAFPFQESEILAEETDREFVDAKSAFGTLRPLESP
ncbi:MAG: penicillin acylase family protein [Planctomycetota bacterium]